MFDVLVYIHSDDFDLLQRADIVFVICGGSLIEVKNRWRCGLSMIILRRPESVWAVSGALTVAPQVRQLRLKEL